MLYYQFILFCLLLPVLFRIKSPFNRLSSAKVIWAALFLIFIIGGLRYEVGGDWTNYELNYASEFAKQISENGSFFSINAFELIHFYSIQFSNSSIPSNIVTSLLLIFGLLSFCKVYSIEAEIVLFFLVPLALWLNAGFVKQAFALALVMIAWSQYGLRNYLAFAIFSALGCSSHPSCVWVFILIPLIEHKKFSFEKGIKVLFIFIPISLFLILFWRGEINSYLGIIRDQTFSPGIFLRLSFYWMVAYLILFAVWRKEFDISFLDRGRFFLLVGCFAPLALLPFNLIVVDRLFYYTIPFQILMISEYSNCVSNSIIRDCFLFNFVLSSVVVYLWFVFGDYSIYWAPFRVFF